MDSFQNKHGVAMVSMTAALFADNCGPHRAKCMSAYLKEVHLYVCVCVRGVWYERWG